MNDKFDKNKSDSNKSEKKPSSFDSLLDELNTLQKSFDDKDDMDDEDYSNPDGDEAIKDAAGKGKGKKSKKEYEDDMDEDYEDDDKMMGKSFTVKLEDGTELEAVEGTELMKSLMLKVNDNRDSMEKALGLAVTNLKSFSEKLTRQTTVVKSQGDLIKSLQENIERIGDQGKGRKTVISVHEKRSPEELRKSDETEQGLGRQEFMAKALSAQREGKVTGLELSQAESYLNRGMSIPESIVNKVLS